MNLDDALDLGAMKIDTKTKYAPSAQIASGAAVRSLEEYKVLYNRSVADDASNDRFWDEQARSLVTWFKPYSRVLSPDCLCIEYHSFDTTELWPSLYYIDCQRVEVDKVMSGDAWTAVRLSENFQRRARRLHSSFRFLPIVVSISSLLSFYKHSREFIFDRFAPCVSLILTMLRRL